MPEIVTFEKGEQQYEVNTVERPGYVCESGGWEDEEGFPQGGCTKNATHVFTGVGGNMHGDGPYFCEEHSKEFSGLKDLP